jgi:hypothetical protein
MKSIIQTNPERTEFGIYISFTRFYWNYFFKGFSWIFEATGQLMDKGVVQQFDGHLPSKRNDLVMVYLFLQLAQSIDNRAPC